MKELKLIVVWQLDNLGLAGLWHKNEPGNRPVPIQQQMCIAEPAEEMTILAQNGIDIESHAYSPLLNHSIV
jgi:hypothetical protein